MFANVVQVRITNEIQRLLTAEFRADLVEALALCLDDVGLGKDVAQEGKRPEREIDGACAVKFHGGQESLTDAKVKEPV